jgi:cytochrome P450
VKPFALADPRQIADPYPVYRRYREADPVHAAGAAGPGLPESWYLFRYDDVEQLLTSRDFGRSAGVARPTAAPLIPDGYDTLRRVVDNWLVFLDPPRHTRLRALVTRHFTARTVAGLRPRVENIAGGLLAQLRERVHTDLVADFAAPLPVLVIGALLGVPAERCGWVRACAGSRPTATALRRWLPVSSVTTSTTRRGGGADNAATI